MVRNLDAEKSYKVNMTIGEGRASNLNQPQETIHALTVRQRGQPLYSRFPCQRPALTCHMARSSHSCPPSKVVEGHIPDLLISVNQAHLGTVIEKTPV